MLEAVNSAHPDIVLVALGSPRQEIFASKLVKHVPGVFAVGCGGALDVLAGKVRRAPRFMVEHKLEWLYRLWKEPSRWRRQIVLPIFFIELAIAALRARLIG
jgi:N-acetylglucosaminyldiphosphoundecaprenol N-acetyl-beta-D-mannosaminyltransferase